MSKHKTTRCFIQIQKYKMKQILVNCATSELETDTVNKNGFLWHC